MKTALLVIVFFFSAAVVYGQKVSFSYDFAGNQIKREFTLFASKALQDEVDNIEEISEEDMIQFFPDDVISYFPNPVREELFIKWELTNGDSIDTIGVYSMTGQELKTIVDNANKNSQAISFQNYPQGTYIVILNYNSGKQESIKIVKK